MALQSILLISTENQETKCLIQNGLFLARPYLTLKLDQWLVDWPLKKGDWFVKFYWLVGCLLTRILGWVVGRFVTCSYSWLVRFMASWLDEPLAAIT